jgi:hypothetical protein
MPEPSLFCVKRLSMSEHRKTQCSELLRRSPEALADTAQLESFHHGQTTLHMHVELRSESETVSTCDKVQSFTQVISR